MKKLFNVFLFIFILALVGCVGLVPADKNVQRKFVYDYTVDSVKKDELWTRARNYFAVTYGDSRSVLHVVDKDAGVLIGKGAVSWVLMANMCVTEYHVQFQSKDNKARLQLEIIEGVPAYSQCTGWPWPSDTGYLKILENFNSISKGLDQALKQGSGLSDF